MMMISSSTSLLPNMRVCVAVAAEGLKTHCTILVQRFLNLLLNTY